MSAGSLQSPGHSAVVRMELRLNGHILPIAQLGPDFLVPANPVDQPPAEGEIALSIDGQESRWSVWLDDGMSLLQRRTRIARCQQVNGSTAG
jgi:hypothetical protein